MNVKKHCGIFAALAACSFVAAAAGFAAENLRLRDGISYVNDLDKGFPIVADKIEDVAIASGRPTFLFFGASGDLNTNRQARRIIEVYKRYKSTDVKFVVIDVDHPSGAQARQLIKQHYTGYIPCEVLFDKGGKQKWSQAGEVEIPTIVNQLDKVLSAS